MCVCLYIYIYIYIYQTTNFEEPSPQRLGLSGPWRGTSLSLSIYIYIHMLSGPWRRTAAAPPARSRRCSSGGAGARLCDELVEVFKLIIVFATFRACHRLLSLRAWRAARPRSRRREQPPLPWAMLLHRSGHVFCYFGFFIVIVVILLCLYHLFDYFLKHMCLLMITVFFCTEASMCKQTKWGWQWWSSPWF